MLDLTSSLYKTEFQAGFRGINVSCKVKQHSYYKPSRDDPKLSRDTHEERMKDVDIKVQIHLFSEQQSHVRQKGKY